MSLNNRYEYVNITQTKDQHILGANQDLPEHRYEYHSGQQIHVNITQTKDQYILGAKTDLKIMDTAIFVHGPHLWVFNMIWKT